MKRLALVAAVAIAFLATGAQAVDSFAVHLVSQDATTITLGWSPQPGYGYLFSGNGQLVSRTNDQSRSSVRFSKQYSSFDVDVITKGANGHYPTVTPPPPKAQCEDGVDNDGDGKIDYPADPGCSSATDNDETNVVVPPAQATVFITPGGNDGAPCTQAAPCRSLNHAYAVAKCGEIIAVGGGNYPDQNVSGSKACQQTWTAGAVRGVTCTSCVTATVASGDVATISEINLNSVQFLSIERGQGAALNVNGGTVDGNSNNLVFRGIHWTCGIFINGDPAQPTPFDNIAFVDGDVSYRIGGAGNCGFPFYLQTCSPCSSSSVGTDFLIDGINMHGMDTEMVNDPHTELIRVDGGWSGVTIRNNTFTTSGNGVTTSTIFVTNIETGGADPSRVTIQNNYFGSNGAAYFTIYFHGNVSSCGTDQILYNTFYEDNGGDSGACSQSGPLWSGNLGPKQSYGGCAGTYVRNLWQDDRQTGCGTDTYVVGPDGGVQNLGLNGFNLTAASPARSAGETANCPATDHDGNPRPQPAGSNCDAGADEVP